MEKKTEKSEKEKRYEGAIAGEGAGEREVELDPKDQNKALAGDPKEQKETAVDKKAREEAEKAEADKQAAASKNLTSTTAAVNAPATTKK